MNKFLAISLALATTLGVTGVTYTYGTASSSVGESKAVKFEPVFDEGTQDMWRPTVIQDKMLNAIDNYKTIKGAYHIRMNAVDRDDRVSFVVKEGASPGSHVKVLQNGTMWAEQNADGKSTLYLNHKDKEYQSDGLDQSTRKKPTVQRKMKAKDGNPVYVYRQDPAAAELAHDVIFPQTYAFWLNDHSRELGHEQILGRDATVIVGVLEQSLRVRRGAVDYKMWVDSNTGVLLKLEERNEVGELINLIEVTELKINESVDESTFSLKAPKEYKDKSVKKQFSK